MRCPECKIRRRSRPVEYDLADLLDHMINEHPATMLEVAKEQLKSIASNNTDVLFVPEKQDAP